MAGDTPVCWRNTGSGNDLALASRLVERVFTVVASCRQQRRNLLAFLANAIQAARTVTTAPALVPAKPQPREKLLSRLAKYFRRDCR